MDLGLLIILFVGIWVFGQCASISEDAYKEKKKR
jgi:hypothetical protein